MEKSLNKREFFYGILIIVSFAPIYVVLYCTVSSMSEAIILTWFVQLFVLTTFGMFSADIRRRANALEKELKKYEYHLNGMLATESCYMYCSHARRLKGYGYCYCNEEGICKDRSRFDPDWGRIALENDMEYYAD